MIIISLYKAKATITAIYGHVRNKHDFSRIMTEGSVYIVSGSQTLNF